MVNIWLMMVHRWSGWWLTYCTPPKNDDGVKVKWDNMKFPIYGKIEFMFQTIKLMQSASAIWVHLISWYFMLVVFCRPLFKKHARAQTMVYPSIISMIYHSYNGLFIFFFDLSHLSRSSTGRELDHPTLLENPRGLDGLTISENALPH